MRTTADFALTAYQKLLIAALACLLFTIVLDFMLLSALSAILLPDLRLSTRQFGWVASAYAFSAGVSALVASGYADRFDRRRFLLFFYGGFLLGVLLCALARSFELLLIARIVTGIFGGVVASICYAIITDLFAGHQRGRVMGFLQMAFAAGQVGGLPMALFIATQYGWPAAYWFILGLGSLAGGFIAWKLAPVTGHLQQAPPPHPWRPLLTNLADGRYRTVFLNNALLVTGDVLLMTFSAAFITNNLGRPEEDLALIYGAIGATTLLCGPLLGRLADQVGKWTIFLAGTIPAMALVTWFTHLPPTPLLGIILLQIGLFIGVNARMITSQALGMAIPRAADRGAFMSVDAALQQVSAGLAAVLAGWLVTQGDDGRMLHFPRLGWVVVCCMGATIVLMRRMEWIRREGR
ncbi:MAG: MFS transporter [Lewinella sp.]|nr:MFS transporter [Lewinella sp.]